MAKKQYSVDMINGPILKSIIAFVAPLIFANFLQLMYNAADIIVVSRFAGSEAMASVGATSSISNLMICLFVGFSVGASVIVSRKFGAHDDEGVHCAVHTSMLLSIIAGFIAMITGISLSSFVLKLMGTPEGNVFDGAVLYMRIMFIGMPANLVYNFGATVLRAIGDTKRPLYILSFSGIVNVVLNFVFVIRFHMSVAGVAWATAISNYISAFAVVFTLVRADGAYKLVFKKLKLYKEELLEILKVGLPAGIQGSMFGISNTLIQSGVNSFGAAAIAGNSAASNIEAFVYTAMNAFSQASITGVSQNYGAKNEKGIYKSYNTCALCVTVVGFLVGLLSAIFGRQLLGIYITDSDAAIDYGMVRVVLTGVTYFFCGLMEVQVGMLRGIGYSTMAMINSLVGVCGFRVLWITFVLPLYRSTHVLYLCWPISWVLVVVMNLICYQIIKKKAIQKMYES